jgi:hypothetical protein
MTLFNPKSLSRSFNIFSTNQTLKYWWHLIKASEIFVKSDQF